MSGTYIPFYLPTGGIRVFKRALNSFGDADYVQFMIDPETLSLALRPFNRKTFASFRVTDSMRRKGDG